MLDFNTFLESLEHVPPEFERNFNLIKDLDSRSNDIIGQVNDLVKKYKESRKLQERQTIKNDINSLMEKMTSYAHDKIELATQTYELIDKNIKSLIVLSKRTDESEIDTVQPPIGYEMPLSEFEPKYCICRDVSYGEMIACDNPECPVEWFHLPCVHLIKVPKAKWFCLECSAKKPKSGRKTAKRKR